MAPSKNYMIPLQFPAGLYDYAKPPGPFAHWTSDPLYSYEEFARSNPRPERKNRSDRKGRAKRNGGGGMPHPYDVPGNAGPFWPDAYPYGAKGRPMAYGPTARELAAAKGNPSKGRPSKTIPVEQVESILIDALHQDAWAKDPRPELHELTRYASLPSFRGVDFRKINRAAERLSKKGKVSFDGVHIHLLKAKGNPETVDPAWKAAAERLLEKRKGKSIDDFTYRAYLRAILQGAMPVTHKDGIPYIGALEARQDLIDEYGKGPARKNPRSSGKGQRAAANPLLSSQKEIQTMRRIWDLGGSGVFDKDLEASGVDMNIVSDLTRRGLLHCKKARSPSRFGTETWSITEDGMTAMRNAKMSMALPNRSKRPSTRTRHNPTAWQKEMRKTSVPKRSKFEVTSIDYIREGTYAFDLDLGKDGYGRITLYPDGYMQSGIMNLTPALRAKMGAWVKKHAKKIKAIPEFGRTYPGNW